MQPYTATVYLLTSSVDPSKIYFGSTLQALNHRFAKHKSDKRRSCTSYKIIELGKEYAQIKPLEYIMCYGTSDDLTELKVYMKEREQYFIKNFECVNKNIPLRQKNDYMKNYYYPKKKDILLNPIICKCGKTTSKQHYLRHEKSKFHKEFLTQIPNF